jgi:flavorubredoxin
MPQPHKRILVLYHSLYGSVYAMAKLIHQGASQVQPGNLTVTLKRIPETLTLQELEKCKALESYKR